MPGLRELHARATKQGDGGVESGQATTALGSEAGSLQHHSKYARALFISPTLYLSALT